MADAAGLTNTVNDFSGIQAFRTPNYNRAIDDIAPQYQDRLLETDSVELSEESLFLSRSNGNEPLEELFKQGEATAAELLQAVPTVIENDLFAADTAGLPVTTDEIGVASSVDLTVREVENPDVTPREDVATQFNTGTQWVTGPLQEEGIRATGAETFKAPVNVPIESPESIQVAAEIAASVNIPAEINADSINRETVQGASGREESDDLLNRRDPQLLEAQAQEAAARSNAVINDTNGINRAAPTPAANIAPEDPRNQENIVLQNVATQLAQTIPPSSIISVLG